MHGRIRRHLTYANVISTLCLFIVLGGGAYAAFHLPRNSVKWRRGSSSATRASTTRG